MHTEEDLLRPSAVSDSAPRYHPERPWPYHYQNKPVLDTAMLQVNKSTSSMAKAVLRSRNKWVFFDIECSHLLLPWACFAVRVIVVDTEDTDGLPLGIMTVKVRLYLNWSRNQQRTDSSWPRGTPQRQIFLVEMEHLEVFPQQLRMMKLTNGIRVMPSAFIQPTTSPLRPLVQAEIGWHGLQMRTDVHGGIPDTNMAKLLE
jgi:hypothetical protein